MSSNIEKFDLLVAKLLVQLYERFPLETGISSATYGIDAGSMFRGDGTVDSDVAAELDFFCSTVRWLGRAGYIEYSGELDSGTFGDVVLTPKALEILKATPASLQAPQALGDYLVDSVRSGTTEAVKQGVTAALTAGTLFLWNTLTK
ncbi:hypothetical protein [Burkholderia multivorans]|uniref:hypothetical protein n=1 Tax=Burkholderia multivorans TaxID=87883 RepID=UPI0019D0E7BE|nr:hypothetical protein [Burkholderia multivorans]MBN6729446.1 hypothetical protein [Burkholderia multivorans]MBN8164815.1 hypothetical protein [Burkholderia multivorans]MBN8167785.1 hypothetical protein [Burkholderia multivorans]MBN8175618.1 hypothetical protein [Burkholderia multivorans]QSL31377.1 hypothetical protein G0D91_10110 [Burkholderia multivorans]